PAPVGTRYRRFLQVGSETIGWQSSVVLDADPKTQLRREWLQITVSVPGGEARTVERDLFVADSPGASDGQPAEYRRYAIAVVPGSIEPAAVESYAARVAKSLDVASAEKTLGRFAGDPKPGADASE